MVEAAKADVIGPAVAADDPDALADQGVGQHGQVTGGSSGDAVVPRGQPVQLFFEPGDTLALGEHALLLVLVRVQDRTGELGAHGSGRQEPSRAARRSFLGVEAHPDAEAELGVVLEQRVGPRRPTSLGVGGPRGRR